MRVGEYATDVLRNTPRNKSCVIKAGVAHADLTEEHSRLTREQMNVVIVDEHALFRDCLARCLIAERDKWSVATFDSVNRWLESASRSPGTPVVVLSGYSSATAVQDDLDLISRTGAMPPIVILAESNDLDPLALAQGVRGYIRRSVTVDVVLEALDIVRVGGTVVAGGCLPSISCGLIEADSTGRNDGTFTMREAAVLKVLREGKSNKRIAFDLNMSESTVKVHVRNIMRKLNAKNRTEVAFLTQGMFERARELVSP